MGAPVYGVIPAMASESPPGVDQGAALPRAPRQSEPLCDADVALDDDGAYRRGG